MAYSVTKVGGFGRPSAYREFVIDSVDDVSTLPTSDIAVGSSAFCIADKSMYAFANSGAWMKCGSSSSDEGEGGSDAGGILVLTLVPTQDHTYALSETWQTIYDAAFAGTLVVINDNLDEHTPNVFNDLVSEIGIGDGSWAEEGAYYVGTVGNQLLTTADSDGYPTFPVIDPIIPDPGQ